MTNSQHHYYKPMSDASRPIRWQPKQFRYATGIIVGLLCSLQFGCGSVDATGVNQISVNPYIRLRLNARSAVMSTVAPYNKFQLVATPYTASGDVLPTESTPVFTTKDTMVTVTPAGVITARYATENTYVVASLRDEQQGVTQVDTIFISVTDQTPATPLQSFSIQRPANDSAKISVFNASYANVQTKEVIRVAGIGANGEDITSDLRIQFGTTAPSVATIDQMGVVTGLRPGKTTITVTTTYYGVTKTDSLTLTVGNPIVVTVQGLAQLSPTVANEYIVVFNPKSITVGAGGTVIFGGAGGLFSPASLTTDIVFEDPSAAQPSSLEGTATGSGNIVIPPLWIDGVLNPACDPSAVCSSVSRRFTKAGVYRFKSEVYGSTGEIVVKG